MIDELKDIWTDISRFSSDIYAGVERVGAYLEARNMLAVLVGNKYEEAIHSIIASERNIYSREVEMLRVDMAIRLAKKGVSSQDILMILDGQYDLIPGFNLWMGV